jgi:hypothetical protein
MVLPNSTKVKSVIVSKEIRSPRIIMKVEGMEPLFGWSEFDNAPVRMHLKDSTAVSAIICNTKLLSKSVKGKNVGNATGVKVDWGGAEIGHLRSTKGTFVAVNIDWGRRRANMVNQIWIGEEIHGRLTIQQNKVRPDARGSRLLSKKNIRVISLGKDKDALLFTGLGGVVRVRHCMDLSRRLGVGAHTGDVTKLATSLALHGGIFLFVTRFVTR